MTLAATLRRVDCSQRELARESGLSLSAVNAAIKRGAWPKRGAAQARASVCTALRKRGATTAELRDIALPKEVGPDVQQHAKAVSPETQLETEKENDPMLFQFTKVADAALRHFGLPRSPFEDDVLSTADVFQSAGTRYARAALMDTARNHRFMALVGESGAGKTTLLEALEQRLIDERADVHIIRPYTLAMEATDTRGKTLRATHIAETLAHALDPQITLKSSPQARFDQLHRLLRESCRAGRQHLLVIDEAHCLPTATLKHLKRFLELKDGLRRVLGVLLIAQPELRELLHSQNHEVREVMQRCEIVDLPPLDNDLEAYLRHKFARFELKLEQVFEPDAFDAIRSRLIYTPRGAKQGVSTCYPLAVHNLVARCMNAAVAAGWPKVDAQCVAGA
jgi:type II secretory pathway predicted ATPase ExeA/lambda repressor-like predicted transcriptional regulator